MEKKVLCFNRHCEPQRLRGSGVYYWTPPEEKAPVGSCLRAQEDFIGRHGPHPSSPAIPRSLAALPRELLEQCHPLCGSVIYNTCRRPGCPTASPPFLICSECSRSGEKQSLRLYLQCFYSVKKKQFPYTHN